MLALLRNWFPYPLPLLWVLAAIFSLAAWELTYLMTIGAGLDATKELVLRDGVAVAAAAALGMARVYLYHPFYQADYACWLALTPWNPSKPLPFAPVHVTPQDLLLLALPIALFHDLQISWACFPLAFLAGYLIYLAWTFLRSGMETYGYTILFGVGLMVRLIPWPELSLIVGAILYDVAMTGLDTWLARFPRPFWPYDRLLPEPVAVGWPLADLREKPDPARSWLGTWAAAPGSLLAGWGAYCGVAAVIGHQAFPIGDFAFLVGVIVFCPAMCAAFPRWGAYMADAQPPIDVWGRLGTGRWIIPGYDVIHLAPLATLLVPPALVAFLLLAGWPLAVAAGISVALLGLIAGCAPPAWSTWRLTGDCCLTRHLAKNLEMSEA
jgi:hypothetical protein